MLLRNAVWMAIDGIVRTVVNSFSRGDRSATRPCDAFYGCFLVRRVQAAAQTVTANSA
jgi:hypothetical protein